MLDTLRKFRRSIAGFVIVGVCSMLMVGFGIGSFSGAGPLSVAATIDGDEIRYNDYFRRLQQVESAAAGQYGENLEKVKAFLNFEQQAIDSLINERLMARFTEMFGLRISTQQIEQQVLSLPYFENGFSQESYQNLLRATGLTGAGLESAMREEMTREQLASLFRDIAAPSPKEIRILQEASGREIQFRYIKIQTDDFLEKAKTDDVKRLEEFYEENKGYYRAPRTVRYSFIEFKPEEFLNRVDISEDEVRAAYEQRKHEFIEEEIVGIDALLGSAESEKKPKRRVRKFEEVKDILLADLKRADAPLYAMAEAENFQKDWELAERGNGASLNAFASTKSRVVQGSGRLMRGDETPPEAFPGLTGSVLPLSEGERRIFELGSSVYFVVVDEVKESFISPFEDVREQVKKDFAEKEAYRLATEFAKTLATEVKTLAAEHSGDAVKIVGEKHGLETLLTEHVSRENASGEPFAHATVLRDWFSLSKVRPVLEHPIIVGDEFYIVALQEEKLGEVKASPERMAEILRAESSVAQNRLYYSLIQNLREDVQIWVNPQIFKSVS